MTDPNLAEVQRLDGEVSRLRNECEDWKQMFRSMRAERDALADSVALLRGMIRDILDIARVRPLWGGEIANYREKAGIRG